MSGRTALYRHFDAANRLLYVGISLSAVQRLAQHRERAAWFEQIAHVTIEWLPSRGAALEAEARAIHDERPMHNRTRPPRPRDRPTWAVEHVPSGRRDGNYCEADAREMLAFFREQHPQDRFEIVSGLRDGGLGATAGRLPLRAFDAVLWSAEA